MEFMNTDMMLVTREILLVSLNEMKIKCTIGNTGIREHIQNVYKSQLKLIYRTFLFPCNFPLLLYLYMCLVLLHCLDEDQALTQSKDSSNAKAKNCRGLIQKRAHTLDDFMTGNIDVNAKFKFIF